MNSQSARKIDGLNFGRKNIFQSEHSQAKINAQPKNQVLIKKKGSMDGLIGVSGKKIVKNKAMQLIPKQPIADKIKDSQEREVKKLIVPPVSQTVQAKSSSSGHAKLLQELEHIKKETEKIQNQFESDMLIVASPKGKQPVKKESKPGSNKKKEKIKKNKKEDDEIEFKLDKIKNYFSGFFSVVRGIGKVLAVITVAYLSFYCSVVFFSLDSPVIRQISKYIILPVFITDQGYSDYFDYLDLRNSYRQTAAETADLRQLVGRQLKIEIILDSLAKKYSVVASSEELASRYRSLISNVKSEEEKKQILGSYYQLGEQRYIEKVVRYDFLKEKLEGYVMLDRNINAVAQARINKIIELLASQDFDQLAKKYGDEYSAGEYFSFGDAEKKFGKEILDLQPKQISRPITSAKGYYLVQCYDRVDSLLGLKYVFVTAKSLDDYLEEETGIMKGWLLYFI